MSHQTFRIADDDSIYSAALTALVESFTNSAIIRTLTVPVSNLRPTLSLALAEEGDASHRQRRLTETNEPIVIWIRWSSFDEKLGLIEKN